MKIKDTHKPRFTGWDGGMGPDPRVITPDGKYFCPNCGTQIGATTPTRRVEYGEVECCRKEYHGRSVAKIMREADAAMAGFVTGSVSKAELWARLTKVKRHLNYYTSADDYRDLWRSISWDKWSRPTIRKKLLRYKLTGKLG